MFVFLFCPTLLPELGGPPSTPSGALREGADVWEPQPLPYSSLHTRFQTKSQPWLSLQDSPARSCQIGFTVLYKSYEVSSPSFSPPLRHPGIEIGQLSRELCSLLSRFLIVPFGLHSVAKMSGLDLKHQCTGQGGP